jgi:plastocyanin
MGIMQFPFNYHRKGSPMKTKRSLILILGLLLAACSPQVAATPAATLPPAATQAPSLEPSPTPGPETSPQATADPGSTPASISTSTSGEAEVDIEDFAFSPANLTIAPGTTVKWSNKDSATHKVLADDGTWGSASLAKGEDFFFTFTTAGVYAYHCGFHASMKGTITVTAP